MWFLYKQIIEKLKTGTLRKRLMWTVQKWINYELMKQGNKYADMFDVIEHEPK